MLISAGGERLRAVGAVELVDPMEVRLDHVFRRGGTSLIGGLDVGDGRFDDRERVGANAGRREGGRGRDPQVVKSHVRCSSGSAVGAVTTGPGTLVLGVG